MEITFLTKIGVSSQKRALVILQAEKRKDRYLYNLKTCGKSCKKPNYLVLRNVHNTYSIYWFGKKQFPLMRILSETFISIYMYTVEEFNGALASKIRLD